MRTARTLMVKKETLTELATSDLESVVGGDTTGQISNMIQPCPTQTGTTVSNMVRPCPTETSPVCDLVSRIIHPCLP